MEKKTSNKEDKAKKQLMQIVLGSLCIILVITIVICAGCISKHSRSQSNNDTYQLSELI